MFVGESVAGARIVEITLSSVTLQYDGLEHVLTVRDRGRQYGRP